MKQNHIGSPLGQQGGDSTDTGGQAIGALPRNTDKQVQGVTAPSMPPPSSDRPGVHAPDSNRLGASAPDSDRSGAPASASDRTGSASSEGNSSPPSAAYRFTPVRQRQFLEVFAQCGTIAGAAKAVGVSRETVYHHRSVTPGFADAMASARLIARDISEEIFASRALHGWQEEVWHRGELVGHRQRYDNRLLLAHMARLDKAAEKMGAIDNVRAKAALHAGVNNFADLLDAVEEEESIEAILRSENYKIWRSLEQAMKEDRSYDLMITRKFLKRCAEEAALDGEDWDGDDSDGDDWDDEEDRPGEAVTDEQAAPPPAFSPSKATSSAKTRQSGATSRTVSDNGIFSPEQCQKVQLAQIFVTVMPKIAPDMPPCPSRGSGMVRTRSRRA